MSKQKKTETTVTTDEQCKTEGCKHAQVRFTFCSEHYEWFKFGLVTKMGKKVSDFDKKFAHYTAHQTGAPFKKAA
jgi:hypothetical protein